jgi:predicted amino acid racemase
VEDKIRWALNSGKPIQIRTTRYLTHDRQFIDSVLNRFLNEAGITFLMNKLSYCVHELATNAKKANTKRVYFQENGLDISDPASYEAGMTDFKRSTLENIEYYLDRQKKMGYYIVVLFHMTEKRLKLSVINNTEMREEEKIRVAQKLELARKADSIRDIYDQA